MQGGTLRALAMGVGSYPSGLQVTKVSPHSPTATVGIEVGGILLSWEENQIYGDDPTKPFANYTIESNNLKGALEQYSKSKGAIAGGGPNKAEILKRMAQRKLLRRESE